MLIWLIGSGRKTGQTGLCQHSKSQRACYWEFVDVIWEHKNFSNLHIFNCENDSLLLVLLEICEEQKILYANANCRFSESLPEMNHWWFILFSVSICEFHQNSNYSQESNWWKTLDVILLPWQRENIHRGTIRFWHEINSKTRLSLKDHMFNAFKPFYYKISKCSVAWYLLMFLRHSVLKTNPILYFLDIPY